jgi:pimeloyl-ACP methyl ester carboxylesterase
MQLYQVENIEIKCRVVGSGPKIMLLHGFGGGTTDWLPMIQILQNHFTVIIPNLSVFFTHKSPLSFSEQVNLLVKLINQLDNDGKGINLIGHSFGGTLSTGVRHIIKERVHSHVLINPMPFNPIKKLKNWQIKWLLKLANLPAFLYLSNKSFFGKRTYRYLAQTFHMGIRGKKKLHVFNSRKYWIIQKALIRFRWIVKNENWLNWEDKVIRDNVPTLMFVSGRDPLFSLKEYEKNRIQFNNLLIDKIEGGGHLTLLTHPKHISKKIVSFLANKYIHLLKDAS